MGNWQLELFKLSLFVTFPVAMFYIYNQPQLFEDWVIRKKRELYPPLSTRETEEMKAFIKSYKLEKEAELLRDLRQEEKLSR